MVLESVRALTHPYMLCIALPKERAQEMVLAVDEACTNSIRCAKER